MKSPCCTILGGQPGAGKTTLHSIVRKSDANTVFVIGDDFRGYHPNFVELNNKYGDSVPYTAFFYGKMTEALIAKLSDERYNLVIEGTLRTVDVPENTAALLKSKGYKTELYVIAVSAEKSWQGTIDRFNEMKAEGAAPRATAKGHHDTVVAALPDNLGVLYDRGTIERICLFTREKECIYDSKFTPDINPKDMIKAILDGKPENYFIKRQEPESSEPATTLAGYKQLIDAERNPAIVNSRIRDSIPSKDIKFER